MDKHNEESSIQDLAGFWTVQNFNYIWGSRVRAIKTIPPCLEVMRIAVGIWKQKKQINKNISVLVRDVSNKILQREGKKVQP